MDNERGLNKRRLSRGLLGAILASAALSGIKAKEPAAPEDLFGLKVARPSRWISRGAKMPRSSSSNHVRHQGKKECARRLKQQARLAA